MAGPDCKFTPGCENIATQSLDIFKRLGDVETRVIAVDERAGVAGADVVVEESGAPVLLVVRLKVAGDKLTELELVATRSLAEGLSFNIDGLSAPTEVMNYAPRPEQLSTRDEAIKGRCTIRPDSTPPGLSPMWTRHLRRVPIATKMEL